MIENAVAANNEPQKRTRFVGSRPSECIECTCINFIDGDPSTQCLQCGHHDDCHGYIITEAGEDVPVTKVSRAFHVSEMFRHDPTPRIGPRFRHRLGRDPDDSPSSSDERIDAPGEWAGLPPLISDSDSESENGDPPR